jgi:hypothetical protein
MSLIHTLHTIIVSSIAAIDIHDLQIGGKCYVRSLTLLFAPISALFSKSSETVAVWPFSAAQCKEVPPSYNSNAERQ